MSGALQILLCTTLPRLAQAYGALAEPVEGISYIVSCQGVPEGFAPKPPAERTDVTLLPLSGLGLSRNRNNAFSHATAPYLLLCDDDERLCTDTLRGIAADFEAHPQWDMIQYQMQGTGKRYPADYITSGELAMRLKVALNVRFDERFGLGSPCLACGEEEVFVHDAKLKGFRLGRLPKTVCTISNPGTGHSFLSSRRVQRSKGAAFCHTLGPARASLRCIREAASCTLRHCANPLPLLRILFWGINYARRS